MFRWFQSTGKLRRYRSNGSMYDINFDGGWVYALRPIDKAGYVCLNRSGLEHVVVFSESASAMEWRERRGLRDWVDVVNVQLSSAPFDHFWWDGVAFSHPYLTANI